MFDPVLKRSWLIVEVLWHQKLPKVLSEHTSLLGIVFTSNRLPRGGGIKLDSVVLFGLWNLPGARLLLDRSWTLIV